MTTRYDLSSVPLQGGYVAKRCPVRAQWDVIQPAAPLGPGTFTQRLFDRGNAFEAEVVALLRAQHADAVSIAGGGESAEVATLRAMREAVPLIFNGRLRDDAARRVGKPDLLVRATAGGYRAVDVKWHAALDAAKPSGMPVPARTSDLAALRYEPAIEDPLFTARRHAEDAFQLAHYQRMLEAVGMAAGDGRAGGIIGTECRVVWQDLDTPVWRTPSISAGMKLRTTMERYDFEFAFRLDIIAAAQRHQADPSVELLVVPVRRNECPSCPWNGYCRPILEEPPGDVSLLPRVGWSQWKAHRDMGVTNRAQLAALDWRTAALVAAKVDVPGLTDSLAHLPGDTRIDNCAGVRPGVARRLAAAGVTTVGEVRSLDRSTARYSAPGMPALPDHIDLARAALGRHPVYRRRGVAGISVPRADVEVDVDMENVETGVYLWGNLVTRRDGSSGTSGYVPFATWEPMTPEVEAGNALRFWRWLMQLKSETAAAGRTFRAYCWNAAAENGYLRRLGLARDLTEAVEDFVASDQWVDLLKVWDSQLITGGSSRLKVIAPLVGAGWAVDNPGGAQSMVQYDVAVSGERDDRRAARAWLLDYNRGDVTATYRVREWMSAARVPGVETIGPDLREPA